MNITDFLLARIAEDEALAQSILDRSAPDPWDNPMETGNFWPEEVAFSDRHSPARVLAECAAKRGVIDIFKDRCPEVFDGERWVSPLAPLAAVYKDHPEYQEAWSA